MKSYSLQKTDSSWQMRWSKYERKDGKKVRSQPVHTIGPASMK